MSSLDKEMQLPLFVKKDDGEGSDFYYLGNMTYIESSAVEEVLSEKPVVRMHFQLDHPIERILYDYLTK